MILNFVSKQRNSNTIREPEEELETSTIDTKVRLNASVLLAFGPNFGRLCVSSPSSQVHTNANDLLHLIRLLNKEHRSGRRIDLIRYLISLTQQPETPNRAKCSNQHDTSNEIDSTMLSPKPSPANGSISLSDFAKDDDDSKRACLCSIQLCIPWYPCKLRYCAAPSHHNEPRYDGADINRRRLRRSVDGLLPPLVRCGIKSCRKCRHFWYSAPSRQHCLWND